EILAQRRDILVAESPEELVLAADHMVDADEVLVVVDLALRIAAEIRFAVELRVAEIRPRPEPEIILRDGRDARGGDAVIGKRLARGEVRDGFEAAVSTAEERLGQVPLLHPRRGIGAEAMAGTAVPQHFGVEGEERLVLDHGAAQ